MEPLGYIATSWEAKVPEMNINEFGELRRFGVGAAGVQSHQSGSQSPRDDELPGPLAGCGDEVLG